jgi:hypothetical protein
MSTWCRQEQEIEMTREDCCELLLEARMEGLREAWVEAVPYTSRALIVERRIRVGDAIDALHDRFVVTGVEIAPWAVEWASKWSEDQAMRLYNVLLGTEQALRATR